MNLKEQMKPIYEKYADVRKRLMILMLVWVATRAVMEIIEIIAVLSKQITAQNMWINLVVLAVCMLFARSVVNGIKLGAYLPMIGGAWMCMSGIRSITTVGNMALLTGLQKAYIFGMLIAGIIQIAVMVIAVADKRNKAYFDETQTTQKQFSDLQVQTRNNLKRK